MTTHGSLFTGAGGLDMAVEQMFGAKTLWRSDIKPAACKLIDHYWPGTNLGDITSIDWTRTPRVTILSGGFPCTDISGAGLQAGLIRYGDGKTRSGLWAEMCRAINTLRPSLVVAENVRTLTSVKADSHVEPCPWCVGDPAPGDVLRALGAVLGDLADIGYDAAWCGLRAADVGAPHGRFRIFILAWPADRNPDGDHGGPVASVQGGPGAEPGRARQVAARDTDGVAGSQECPRCGGSGQVGGPRALEGAVRPDGAPAAADPFGLGCDGRARDERRRSQTRAAVTGGSAIDWREYTAAVEQWGRILGRPAPHPTTFGPKGGRALSPDLTDWMMGWPAGWTDIPGLTAPQRLSLGGDGVVPQQAIAALTWLLAHAERKAA